MSAATEAVGVIVMNLGGPDSLGAVRPFLYNLFSDRNIIRLGPAFMQKPLAWLIARRRAPKSEGYYSQIGGRSPLLEITMGQAAALEARLREHGNYKTYVGMRYWKPYIESAVRTAEKDGVKKLISLSLYPQYSIATTGSSEAALEEAMRGRGMQHVAVPPWYDNARYLDIMASMIREGLSQMGPEAHVLFSAHSLPVSFIEEGDPYEKHIKATIEALATRLTEMKWSLGYQSRSGPVKWLTPATEECIKECAGRGVKDLLIVPISFVSDHIETLYEIDILYSRMAGGLGMRLMRTRSLNSHPQFIHALEELVLKTSRSAGWA